MSVKSGKKNRNNVALSALTASLLAVALAPMAQAGNVDYGTDAGIAIGAVGPNDQITFYNWDLAVGSQITTVSTTPTSGLPIAILPSTYVGDQYWVYTVNDANITETATTAITGEVLLEESGNVTGTAGGSTTVTTMWDQADKRIFCNDTNGCTYGTATYAFDALMDTITSVTGDWDGNTAGNFVEGEPTPGTPVVTPGNGGNLIMTGNGSFGGDLYVNGTIYGGSNVTGTWVPGNLTLHGGSNSTTAVLNDVGMNVDTTGAGGGVIYNVANVTIWADQNAGGNGDVNIKVGNQTVASFDNTAGSDIDFYADLDMNGMNITGIGTITATDANITGTATIGTLNVTGNAAIQGDLDMTNGNISNVNVITATTGNITTINSTTGNITTINSTTINNAGNITNQGNLVNNGNVTVNGTSTLNGATTVNNSFTVDTNGATGNTTGTGRVVVSNNTAIVGVQNAGAGLNGLTANSTGTVVSGGTGTATLTLQQNSAVLNSGASSTVSLTTNNATMHGYDTAEINNAYGTYFSAEGYTASAYGNGASMSLNGYNADITNSYGSGLNTNGYEAYVYGYELAQMSNAYGSGFQAAGSGAYMYGQSEAVVSGGGSSMRLDSDGATFSGEGGSPIRVHGVADGKAKHDAVNVGQLDSVKNSLSGGIASISAIANIPHVDPKKTFAIGVGYGNYDGQSGYAFGGSYRFMEDGVLKASVAGSDDGETAWGVGAGFSW